MNVKIKYFSATFLMLIMSIPLTYAETVPQCNPNGYFNCDDGHLKNANACENAYAYWSGHKSQGYNCAWDNKRNKCYQTGGKLCVKSSLTSNEDLDSPSDNNNEVSDISTPQ